MNIPIPTKELLTKDALSDFEDIWRASNPGQEISPQELYEQAKRVIQAVALIYRPIPANQAELLKHL